MKTDATVWKTVPWSVHPEVLHAIVIPGHGIYGGLPVDVAQGIVDAMNSQHKLGAAINKMLTQPTFVPYLEGL